MERNKDLVPKGAKLIFNFQLFWKDWKQYVAYLLSQQINQTRSCESYIWINEASSLNQLGQIRVRVSVCLS